MPPDTGVEIKIDVHLYGFNIESLGFVVGCGAGISRRRGEIGEIVGYGTLMMRGYHQQPEQTAEVIWTDGRGRTYLRTGDIGRQDEDGYLYVLDRKKDMMISGGQNVYPIDIEEVLSRHPDVAEVAVIGIPHERWGETPLALVVRRPGGMPGEDELREWANRQLASYQRISSVEFRAELPRNQLGKLLKREIRRLTGREPNRLSLGLTPALPAPVDGLAPIIILTGLTRPERSRADRIPSACHGPGLN